MAIGACISTRRTQPCVGFARPHKRHGEGIPVWVFKIHVSLTFYRVICGELRQTWISSRPFSFSIRNLLALFAPCMTYGVGQVYGQYPHTKLRFSRCVGGTPISFRFRYRRQGSYTT